jgi:hypothetical protein
MADQVHWRLSGDYFENCSCSVVCPCLVSAAPPLTSQPTEGSCNVPAVFHIESGRYGDIALDGLNVALAVQTPGPMADGNWSVAAYIDERADDKQTEALGAIFTGAAGGPMAAFAPLIGRNLGLKKVPITFRIEGKKRSGEIPGILHLAVDPLPTAHPSGEMWANRARQVGVRRGSVREYVRGSWLQLGQFRQERSLRADRLVKSGVSVSWRGLISGTQQSAPPRGGLFSFMTRDVRSWALSFRTGPKQGMRALSNPRVWRTLPEGLGLAQPDRPIREVNPPTDGFA